MQADEFLAVRRRLNMSRVEFARALGYEGNHSTNFKAIKLLEMGRRNISADIESRVRNLEAEYAV